MNILVIMRVFSEAYYMLKTQQTIREIAKVFNVSKSTVHKDLHERLYECDKELYKKIEQIMTYHKQVRHIRGGQSTKLKYLNNS